MSEIEAMISVKNDLEPGASCSSNLWKRRCILAYKFCEIKFPDCHVQAHRFNVLRAAIASTSYKVAGRITGPPHKWLQHCVMVCILLTVFETRLTTCWHWKEAGMGAKDGLWLYSHAIVPLMNNTCFSPQKLWTPSTYNLAWESHNADCRKSMSRIDPFELLYANILQWVGWNSADVITSARTNKNIFNVMVKGNCSVRGSIKLEK